MSPVGQLAGIAGCDANAGRCRPRPVKLSPPAPAGSRSAYLLDRELYDVQPEDPPHVEPPSWRCSPVGVPAALAQDPLDDPPRRSPTSIPPDEGTAGTAASGGDLNNDIGSLPVTGLDLLNVAGVGLVLGAPA